MNNKIRVRFAPSPTGPLHIGGVRTALYNYLFAKNHGGTFILRIEDTDRSRFVDGAQEYLLDSLKWCNIPNDEGPVKGGDFGPYRQSERKEIYKKYVNFLLESGTAYYAFDTPAELEEARKNAEIEKSVFQYSHVNRTEMKNSLSLDAGTVKNFLEEKVPYVVRLKVPENETIVVHDLIRGEVKVSSAEIDDKVLIKSDGMPTYHLANVIDDHLMEISHVIRGEEWLPSAPLHVLLYRYLGWEDTIPAFAHLPLLLKPDGKGKLSKRDGLKGGFPVFPLSWNDPNSSEDLKGFRESGYIPEAFINFLAFLGWNPGDEQEIFSMEELIGAFSLERIGKAGARFDIEKANWFNQQYLKKTDPVLLGHFLSEDLKRAGIMAEKEKIEAVSLAMRERITFPSDIWDQGKFFFIAPEEYDEKIVRKKWTLENVTILKHFATELNKVEVLTADNARGTLERVTGLYNTGMGKVMQPLRMVLTGKAGGPDLMQIIEILGPKESSIRIYNAIDRLDVKVTGN